MPDKVQCCRCGYLAIRHRTSRELMEVERGIRNDGSFPTSGDYKTGGVISFGPEYIHVIQPVCFVMEKEFCDDAKDIADRDIDGFRAVMSKVRSCNSFVDWKQGWTPREHLEMSMMKEAADREDQRDDVAGQREDRRDDAQKKQHRFEMCLIGVVAVATLYMQYQTTQMQIQNHAQDVVESEAKSAVQRELDSRIKPVANPAQPIQPPASDDAPADATAPAK